VSLGSTDGSQCQRLMQERVRQGALHSNVRVASASGNDCVLFECAEHTLDTMYQEE
jgi:hypothetical protein